MIDTNTSVAIVLGMIIAYFIYRLFEYKQSAERVIEDVVKRADEVEKTDIKKINDATETVKTVTEEVKNDLVAKTLENEIAEEAKKVVKRIRKAEKTVVDEVKAVEEKVKTAVKRKTKKNG